MAIIQVGEVYSTNEGGSVTVVEYVNSKKIKIQHNDEYGYVVWKTSSDIRRGQAKNPYWRSLYGVGFYGVGQYTARVPGGGHTPEYTTWKTMFGRCYDPRYHERQPTYIGCSVHESWHNFQDFAEWFHNQHRQEGWQLDKDLIKRGNKVYCPDFCRFVPRQINSLLGDRGAERGECPLGVRPNHTGFSSRLNEDGVNRHLGTFSTPERAFAVYKEAKEEAIKRTANRFKEVLDPLVYAYLMTYEVEP